MEFARAHHKYARKKEKIGSIDPGVKKIKHVKKIERLDLSDVRENLDPIPSVTAGASSKFKGVTWRANEHKWLARYRGITLGHFDSERAAGVEYARAKFDQQHSQGADQIRKRQREPVEGTSSSAPGPAPAENWPPTPGSRLGPGTDMRKQSGEDGQSMNNNVNNV